MVDPIKLDPGSYRGTYKLIGGSVALDFANLVSYRSATEQHDWLEPATNLAGWAEAVGLATPVSADVASVREFREVVARTFLAVADGKSPSPDDIDHIGKAAAGAWADRRLAPADDSLGARWTGTAPSICGEVALAAASLLTSGERLHRIAACVECRWLFLDTTRNRSRQWCDPADCGNRARQRRHYRRHR
jgi:predicted RNA-binding Zn ribbon-like protein